MSALPRLHPAAEVAEALGQSERYVLDRARSGAWPHRKGARGAVLFSNEDYLQVLELIAVPVQAPAEKRLSFAPRSGIRQTA